MSLKMLLAKWWQFGAGSFSHISWKKIFVFWLKFHWISFLKGTIYNNVLFIYVMTWCQTGKKPLPEPMLTQFTVTYEYDCY